MLHIFGLKNSRELLLAIETIQSLHRVLDGSKYAFDIDSYYSTVIEKSLAFLSNSGGSEIPPYMDKVQIYYAVPVFLHSNLVNTSISQNEKRYSVLKDVGEGSYAKVYKYKDEFYHKNFALKRAKKDLNDEEIDRFHREYDEMKKLNSPYVVEVYRYLNNNEYIMEYLDCSLLNYIKKNNQNLSYAEKQNLVKQVLKAFKYLHSKGLLHRDISPSNILLKIYENVVVVKIADFGLVKVPNSQLTNLNTELKGSFNDSGLATEGFQNYDILHETYALTKLIFFIITGKTNVSNIKNASLNQFVQKGLSADKPKRYQSVNELSSAVTELRV